MATNEVFFTESKPYVMGGSLMWFPSFMLAERHARELVAKQRCAVTIYHHAEGRSLDIVVAMVSRDFRDRIWTDVLDQELA